MSTLQEFFTASPKEQETVAAWGLRLEEIMQRAIDKGQVRTEEKNNLLRDKFWRPLRSERLKTATKYEFRTVFDFEQLVKAVRTEEPRPSSPVRQVLRAPDHFFGRICYPPYHCFAVLSLLSCL